MSGYDDFAPQPAVPLQAESWRPVPQLLRGYQLCYPCLFEATKLDDVEPTVAVTTVAGTAVCTYHVPSVANSSLFGIDYLQELNRRVEEAGA